MTTTGSTSARIAVQSARRNSAALAFSRVWKSPPRATKRHAKIKGPAISAPGTMAAMKRPESDTLAIAPNTTRAMEGGITGAITPPPASSPPEAPSGELPTFIIGIWIAARPAALAMAEPESDAMMSEAQIATLPNPPDTWPKAASMIRQDRRPRFISSPARMKKGIARRMKVSAPRIMFCATA